MPTFHRLSIFLFLLLSATLASAQPSANYYYLKYGPESGLPRTSVYGITQDEEGYIWIGSDRGLVKFDGATFRTDVTDVPFPSQLIDRVFHIREDSFVVFGRFPLGFYSLKGRKWSSIDISNVDDIGLAHVQQAPDKSISFRSGREVYLLTQNGAITIHRYPVGEINMHTAHIGFNADSFLIGREHETFFIGNKKQPIEDHRYYTNFYDLNDSLLLFTRDSLYSLNNGRVKSITGIELKGQRVIYSLTDRFDRVWFVGESRGLFVMENGEVKEISKYLGIEGDYVTYLFKDRDDNIWISTASLGLFCFPKSVFTNYGLAQGLSALNVTDLLLWRGDLLVGTNMGLNRVTSKGIVSGSTLAKEMGVCDDNYPFFNDYIFAISTDSKRLSVGAKNIDHLKNYCDKYPIFTRSIGPALYRDDTLITGGWGRLHSWIIPELEYLGDQPSTTSGGSSKNYFLADIGNGFILVGESIGLFRTTSSFEKTTAIDINIIKGATAFYDFKKDANGGWWFATNKGLLHRDATKKWKLWEKKDGLLSNTITALEFDSERTLWLGTDVGLNTFYKGTFSSYTQGSGLVSNKVSSLLYHDSLNVLWVGTNKGLSKLDLNNAQTPGSPSFPLYITDIEVVGDSVYKTEDIVELEKDQNNLKIHFTSLNYNSPSEIQYQYRLMPGDSIWKTSNQNVAEFPSLGPLDYVFEVRSRTPGKSWGNIASKPFRIVPPIWQSSSFTWGLMIVLLGFTVILFRLRLKVIRQREQNKNLMLEKINHLEQQALSLTMNPHFIFNSLNSIQFYLSGLKNREATKYVSDFAKLIRLNMDSSEKRSIALSQEMERLSVYLSLEKARFDKQFDYEIHIDEELKSYDPSIPNMVIQPLIENGIWHGILPSSKPGKIVVTIENKDLKAVLITVSDNGIGLTAAKKNARKNHNSKGISLTIERLKYLSEKNYLRLEELFDANQNSLGTQSILYLELDLE